ncbi:hypothetical protein [Streptomyces sp. NPDC051994]|uniref:hypothetical protein n=1 Tax=Streptomyces sp. NPDC051994 TaxID=3155287 RepID=UPI003440E9D4
MSADRRLLEAVYEALNLPYPATIGDRDVRDRILVERVMHARVALSAVVARGDNPEWSADWLRDRIAEHPATGYRVFGEAPR